MVSDVVSDVVAVVAAGRDWSAVQVTDEAAKGNSSGA